MDNQHKQNHSDWEFNIDLDSIREQAAREEAESKNAADQLMSQLDQMSASHGTDESQPEDLRLDFTEPDTETEKGPQPPKEARPDTAEQTITIPTQPASPPHRSAPSKTQVFSEPASRPQTRTVAASTASSNRGSSGRKNTQSSSANRPGTGKTGSSAVSALSPQQQRKQDKAQRRRQKRLDRVEKSRQRPKFRLAPVLASLLAITNVLTLGALGLNYMQTSITVKNAEETAKQAQKTVEDVNAQMDELRKETVPLDQFQYNVAEYNIMTEFIQEFFADKIVYKDTSVHYADIDQSLPMNSYDWEALSWENGRPSYQPAEARHSSLGIDVSYHQGNIDWAAVANDGIDFAIIRCGYRGYGNGELVTDSNYHSYMENAQANGLDTGVYFFSQAISETEAVEEAEYVLSLLTDYQVQMPVVFDMEVLNEDARANDLTSAQRASIAAAFCDTIQAAGYTPMIYGNTAYYMSKIDFAALSGKYGIWLAQYYKKPFFPYAFSLWQYTDSGSVSGIDGNVDLNLYFGE